MSLKLNYILDKSLHKLRALVCLSVTPSRTVLRTKWNGASEALCLDAINNTVIR